jgi:hypothetical protein
MAGWSLFSSKTMDIDVKVGIIKPEGGKFKWNNFLLNPKK